VAIRWKALRRQKFAEFVPGRPAPTKTFLIYLRITLSPLYFTGAGATALVIAWATVFVHARRVANADPVHALR
jgi:hypothetical protein